MIVCHCNALRESQVRAAARECEPDVDEVYARLGCEVQCGGCVSFAEMIVREESRVLLAA